MGTPKTYYYRGISFGDLLSLSPLSVTGRIERNKEIGGFLRNSFDFFSFFILFVQHIPKPFVFVSNNSVLYFRGAALACFQPHPNPSRFSRPFEADCEHFPGKLSASAVTHCLPLQWKGDTRNIKKMFTFSRFRADKNSDGLLIRGIACS